MKAGCLKASNRRPPPIDPDKPIPDAAFGPYVFHKYHANHQGVAMGYSGSLGESQAAFDEFLEKQKAILREAGLGADGEGDWNKLATKPQARLLTPSHALSRLLVPSRATAAALAQARLAAADRTPSDAS